MENYRENALNMIKDRPQELCKMCGKCCRVATTKDSYKVLLEKQANGDIEASDFLRIFEPFETIEDARKESAEIVDNILKRSSKNPEDITFYKCRYLRDDNKCGDYENRPLLCKLCPLTPWSIVPPDCGFEAWLEEQKELKIKEIKHQKDNLKELEELLKFAKNQHQTDEINKRIETIKEILAYYEKYGANEW